MALSTYDPNRKLNPDGTPYNNGIAGKPEAPILDAQGNVYETLKSAQQKPTPLPRPDFQESVDELHTNKNPLQTLRTYESDIADAVKHKGVSTIKIAAAEAIRQDEESVPRPARVLLMTVLSIGFIVAGLGAIGILAAAYIIKWSATPPVANTVVQTVLITDTQQSLLLPIGSTIANALSTQNFTPRGTPNSLVGLTIVTGTDASNTPIDSSSFTMRLPSTLPGLLNRSLQPEFAVGYQLLGTIPQPFIVFKTTSYDNAFAGMLAWEPTLSADMSRLALKSENAGTVSMAAPTSQPTSASSTQNISSSTPKNILLNTPLTFQDGIVDNINVRILKRTDGTPSVVYALPDSSTIIITTNETTMKAILIRLSARPFTQQ